MYVKINRHLCLHTWTVMLTSSEGHGNKGISNKIKVMKRHACGFRDEQYFKLRLYALHDGRITRNVG